MENSVLHVAYCTDTNYIMPTGVAMISLCENNKSSDITFHIVITQGEQSINSDSELLIPLKNIVAKYEKKLCFYFIESDKIKEFECKGEHAQYISTTAFVRILLPDILSDSISKVLYMDCDTAVVGSLEDLWNTKLEDDCPYGAVIDVHGLSGVRRSYIKTPLVEPYCNSGVLLMNLDCWRREGLSEKTMKCAVEMQFPLLDQDVLNYLYGSRLKLLSVKYNMQISFMLSSELHWHVEHQWLDDIRESIKNPVIIHYVHAMKPWKDAPAPYADMWCKYKEMSIWKNLPLQHIVAPFIHSEFRKEIEHIYYGDTDMTLYACKPFLRYLHAVQRFRNKRRILGAFSPFINMYAWLLEKIYCIKVKC